MGNLHSIDRLILQNSIVTINYHDYNHQNSGMFLATFINCNNEAFLFETSLN